MLSAQDIVEVEEAINSAEKLTSGEIRVYVARHCKGDVYEKACSLFIKLKMENTAQRNGVLIYIAPEDRKTAIVADDGINNFVTPSFWQETINELISQCAKGKIKEGLCASVQRVGELLQERFPYQENDKNELSNEIIIEE